MGGRSGAAAAAEEWIAAVRKHSTDEGGWSSANFWIDVMTDTDRVIRDDPRGGETTAIVAVVTRGGIVGASVGDSGAWLIRVDAYDDLTRAQIRKPGLGTGLAMPMPLQHKGKFDGTLLLATDGLLKYTTPQAICRHVASKADLDGLPKALIDLVRMPSGGLQDDVAIAICRWEG
jgi:serine/threonine protein phosphatase PrpC